MTIVDADILIEMVKCCYFVGNCKLCPMYKAPKFGMIGSCIGPKKVGGLMLDFLIRVKAKDELEQLQLISQAQPEEADPDDGAQDPDEGAQDPDDGAQDPEAAEVA